MEIRAKALAVPNLPGPGRPVLFDGDKCNGCNACVEICVMDILLPNPVRGKPPIILYPEECHYDGICVKTCPRDGAIRLNHPLMNRACWKRKETGEHFRT
jgi:NAD-dependent dihydropyrimidine dehydrogenase PreA subunit